MDPTTLAVGNSVIFGGQVIKAVTATSRAAITFDPDSAVVPLSDSLWQIAAINNPALPPLPATLLGGNVFLSNGNYFFDATRSITPAMLLKTCQDAVSALLSAGVS